MTDQAVANSTTPTPPEADRRTFRCEATPTWLNLAALMGGSEPPAANQGLAMAYLGSGSGVTPAVVAAAHPQAVIHAWAPAPEPLDATRRLGIAAGLDNLHVSAGDLTPALWGGSLLDMVMVEGIIDSHDEQARAAVVATIGSCLRPGGLVCVMTRTLAGWSEIAPVAAFLRHIVRGDGADADDTFVDAVGLLERLRDGGAAYLTQRPVVCAWLDELALMPPSQARQIYATSHFRPVSHAEVVSVFAGLGCHFVGPAAMTSSPALAASLRDAIDAAPSVLARETFADLAVRRTHRVDLFQFGRFEMDWHQQDERLGAIELVGLGATAEPGLTPEPPANQGSAVICDGVAARLASGTATVAELVAEADTTQTASDLVRQLVGQRYAHPVSGDAGAPRATAAAARLGATLNGPSVPVGDRWLVSPVAGTALPALGTDPDTCARLGIS